MTVIERALEMFPATAAADWRTVGEAAVHQDCVIGDRCVFPGPAILRGGVFLRGVFHGGVFHGTPLQVVGMFRGDVTIGRPGEVSVGCECHPPAYWREHISEIAARHGVDTQEQQRVMEAVEIAAQWLLANPGIVTKQ